MRGRLGKAAADAAYEVPGRRLAATGAAVLVYVGSGASHSWIWFCDLLERLGLCDVRFITESEVHAGVLADADALLIGGGDTYAMAEGLGESGARAVEEFVRRGGFYHGSCAGAYLVMGGVDRAPFTPFDLIKARMLNVMREPPAPLCLDHKYLAPYGEEWVFHPVYGEVLIATEAGRSMPAPLFGGPILEVEDPSDEVARYAGSTRRSACLWPRREADRFMTGRQAVAASGLGMGRVMVSGPHLEHPLFPASNCLVADELAGHLSGRKSHGRSRAGRPAQAVEAVEADVPEIRRQVSNARIVGFGLEELPVTWRIGVKVWEPEKIRMFLEYTWDRLDYLEERKAAGSRLLAARGEGVPLADSYAEVTALARTLRIKVESGRDSQADAALLLGRLKELTARFLGLCFALRAEERLATDGSTRCEA